MGSPSQNSDNLSMSLHEGDLSLFVLSSESACSLAFPHDSRQHEAPVGSRAQGFPEQWVEISSYVICLTDSVMATEREPRHWSVCSSHPCIQQPTWERLLQVLNLKRARCHPPSRGPDTFMGHKCQIGELGFYLGVYWDGASFLPKLGHASELSKVPITDSETSVGWTDPILTRVHLFLSVLSFYTPHTSLISLLEPGATICFIPGQVVLDCIIKQTEQAMES